MTDKELEKIAKNDKVKYYYIRKGGGYYRPSASGYTDYRTMAGVYPTEVAIRHATHCRELTLIPVKIEDHNKTIMGSIKDLLSRYLD